MIGIDPHQAHRREWRMRYRLLLALPVVVVAMLIARHLYGGGGAVTIIAGALALLITIEVVRALTSDDGL